MLSVVFMIASHIIVSLYFVEEGESKKDCPKGMNPIGEFTLLNDAIRPTVLVKRLDSFRAAEACRHSIEFNVWSLFSGLVSTAPREYRFLSFMLACL